MGADADTAVVLCRGGHPLQHLIALAQCPLAFVDCDLPLDEQVAACGATPVIIIYGRPADLLALEDAVLVHLLSWLPAADLARFGATCRAVRSPSPPACLLRRAADPQRDRARVARRRAAARGLARLRAAARVPHGFVRARGQCHRARARAPGLRRQRRPAPRGTPSGRRRWPAAASARRPAARS